MAAALVTVAVVVSGGGNVDLGKGLRGGGRLVSG